MSHLKAPLDPALAGQFVPVAIRLCFPEAETTDVMIGDQMFKVENTNIIAAHQKVDELVAEEGEVG